MDVMEKLTEEGLRNIFKTLGRLSTDLRLNEEEQTAISFITGFAGAALEEQSGVDFTDAFYEGSHE